MRSIRRRLLLTLLCVVLAGVASAGWLIYRQAQTEVNELFDYQLQQTAAALPSEPFSELSESQAGVERNGDVVIQIWSRTGTQLYYSHPRRIGLFYRAHRTGRLARVWRGDRRQRGTGGATGQYPQ